MAYYKKHLNYNFDQVLNEVDRKYTYENEYLLFRRNFLIVCEDKIVGDRTVLPPVFKNKKKPGRTKKKRHRNRSLCGRSSTSNVRCSRCGRAGHNVRTCVGADRVSRQQDEEEEKVKEDPASEDPFKDFNELDLL